MSGDWEWHRTNHISGFEDMALVADALPELTRLQIGNLLAGHMGKFGTFIPAFRKLDILVLDRIGADLPFLGDNNTSPFILVSNARSQDEAIRFIKHHPTSGSTPVPMLVRSTSLQQLYLRFRKPGAFYIAHCNLTKLVVSGCRSTRELVTKDELTHWPNTESRAVAVQTTSKNYFVSASLQQSLAAYPWSNALSLNSAPLNYVTSYGGEVGSPDLGMHADVLDRIQQGLLNVTIAHLGKHIVVKTDWEQNEDFVSFQASF